MAIQVTVTRKKVNTNYYGNSSPLYTFNETANSDQDNVGTGSAVHTEKGTLIGLVDAEFLTHNVSHAWLEDFLEQPIEVLLEVYRMELQGDGTYAKQNVPWGYADAVQPTLTGFDIIINADFTPDLTGVIIKFKFDEV